MKKNNIKDIIKTSAIVIASTLMFVYFQYNEVREQESVQKIPSFDYWKMFAEIKKERRYIEEAGAYYRIPVFTPELLAQSGEEITISGYYLPYSKLDSVIILSRYPNASCFFCGQAGIESVAMVELGKPDQDTYRMDQMLLVKGKLSLNSTDVNKLAFVITEAKIETTGL